jgi:hypothetical protein
LNFFLVIRSASELNSRRFHFTSTYTLALNRFNSYSTMLCMANKCGEFGNFQRWFVPSIINFESPSTISEVIPSRSIATDRAHRRASTKAQYSAVLFVGGYSSGGLPLFDAITGPAVSFRSTHAHRASVFSFRPVLAPSKFKKYLTGLASCVLRARDPFYLPPPSRSIGRQRRPGSSTFPTKLTPRVVAG